MQIVFSDSAVSSPGIWLTSVPPRQLAMFGAPSGSRGNTSVVLISNPQFDEEKDQLSVEVEGLTVLNVGTTNRTLVVDTAAGNPTSALGSGEAQGEGDREYRSLVDVHLKGEAREVAHELLTKVREDSPGDLKRGERNNFSNTPDNFWYVIVQPRTQALSITVRGEPEKFGPSSLGLVADRPGYTRFQLRSFENLDEALDIIRRSRRKPTRLAFLQGRGSFSSRGP